ncbi:F-box/LRR-repeat protein 4 [Elysia marginata]|uniref:F-box/LRR-repeat protein 4 n=1 Tax=Elysia marginata TaxID=1093978 RepID=A0AAV4I5J8_9GAST|nr:F-box/LRR-repeat protein 4 [Elysia marginata]
MARSLDDVTKSANIINEATQHFYEVEKREGNVSPLAEGQIRLQGAQVTNFSSQYGSESSISYVALNLAGQLSIFPKYGDYTQSCVVRTYGPWWKDAPASTKPYHGTPSFTSEDFLEVSFSEYLYPVRVEIYETYNPGSVVRILACDGAGGTDTDRGKVTWATLWAQDKPQLAKQRPRIFAPPIKKVNFATNLIRIELNSSYLDYYSELDGIKLVGTLTLPMDEIFRNLPPLCFADEDWAENNVIQSKKSLQNEEKNLYLRVISDLECKLGDLELTSTEDSEENFFTYLPRELLQLILSYLDLSALCKLAQTCTLLKDNCYDPLLYADLNLQPFWSQISGFHLVNLVSRCERVQRLNLSWLGGAGHIHHQVLRRLLSSIRKLQVLELSCCKFINSLYLISIIESCRTLTELNLSGCTSIEDFSIFNTHSLTQLKRLNLYRTKIDAQPMMSLLQSNPDLEFLNMSSCVCLRPQANQILAHIGLCCKKLRGLDIWRTTNISDDGFSYIYNNCSQLEDLDVGWTAALYSQTGCFVNLARNCKKLKKIFLTANRTLRDCDLLAFAEHCPDLEQLDILGSRSVDEGAILEVLEKCTKLTFLDVSFCVGISEGNACEWRDAFPHVDIKRSFQDISSS